MGRAKASGAGMGFIPNPRLKLLGQVTETIRRLRHPDDARFVRAQRCEHNPIRTDGMAKPGLGVRSPLDAG